MHVVVSTEYRGRPWITCSSSTPKGSSEQSKFALIRTGRAVRPPVKYLFMTMAVVDVFRRLFENRNSTQWAFHFTTMSSYTFCDRNFVLCWIECDITAHITYTHPYRHSGRELTPCRCWFCLCSMSCDTNVHFSHIVLLEQLINVNVFFCWHFSFICVCNSS